MAKLDEFKEKIKFLTKVLTMLVGIVVLVTSGLIGLYLKQNFLVIFWLGITFSVFIALITSILFVKITNLLKKVGEL
jgi:hypothetical protein